jgi:hypothetical protein
MYTKIVKDILKYVLEKNEGYKTIKTYSKVRTGNQNVNLEIKQKFLNYLNMHPQQV